MKILNSEIQKFNKGTQYESNVFVVNISDACDYQGQFIDSISLVIKENNHLKLEYIFAENKKYNIYELYFKIK